MLVRDYLLLVQPTSLFFFPPFFFFPEVVDQTVLCVCFWFINCLLLVLVFLVIHLVDDADLYLLLGHSLPKQRLQFVSNFSVRRFIN